jgi:hypothetical protein
VEVEIVGTPYSEAEVEGEEVVGKVDTPYFEAEVEGEEVVGMVDTLYSEEGEVQTVGTQYFEVGSSHNFQDEELHFRNYK